MKAILTDTTLCIGCRDCVVACRKANALEPEVPRRWETRDGLSARNWTSIVERPGPVYVRKQCRHCLEPACASACPVGALRRTPEGAVVYDGSKCMGCRYCMMACPYGIPRYDWDLAVPYVRKCILCYDRLKEGKQPACTEICPTEATIFGDREALLQEARRRIRENPGRYADKIWGETEVGGTSVFYISDADLSFLTRGRELAQTPMPAHTASAMHAVPFAFFGMAATMAGISWIIGRRMDLQQKSPEDKKDDDHE
ncbi:MAG: 4Fe-4S dicluster domain-containing protein [Candidatus Zixiibacteriota bacterium]|nr:MAG: 4Fe-4S dicluster domain-containing protein [candidate division Zixibacteria bacterium]